MSGADDPRRTSAIIRARLWPRTVRPWLAQLVERPTRASIRDAVAQAGLPVELERVVVRVLRRARLWRREQLDVARELGAHFAEGLAAGRSAGELLGGFGDPDATARLIGRAKRRSRPLWWHGWRLTVRCVGMLMLAAVGLYAVMAARYFTARPSITRNYVAEINAAALAIPEAERAWPVYRRAYIELEPLPATLNEHWPVTSPSSPAWMAAAAYLERNDVALNLVYAAARLPSLGAALGEETPEALEQLRAARHGSDSGAAGTASSAAAPARAEPELSLYGAPQPFIPVIRWSARLLRADLAAAAEAGNAARVEHALEALFRLGSHAREQRFLIGVLVAQAIDAFAYDAIGSILSEHPELVSSAWLRSLGHSVVSVEDPMEQVAAAIRGERTAFLDFVQRLYSDDGSGDGRITAEGVASFNALVYPDGSVPEGGLERALMPIAAGTALGRRELVAFYDDVTRRGLEELRTPLWRRTPELSAAQYLEASTRGLYNKARYWPAHMLVPAFSHLSRSVYQIQARRDAAIIAIALELYRREHGKLPTTLGELTPRYLPRVPADPFDGQPLRYRLIGSRAVVYSIGTDGVDDGGTPNAASAAAASVPPPVPGLPPSSPAHSAWMKQVGGDWVLHQREAAAGVE